LLKENFYDNIQIFLIIIAKKQGRKTMKKVSSFISSFLFVSLIILSILILRDFLKETRTKDASVTHLTNENFVSDYIILKNKR